MRVAHLMLLVGRSAGCASVQEERALRVWHYEKDQLQASTDVALDSQVGLAAYARYAQFNHPGLKAALLEFQLFHERARTDQGVYAAEIEHLVGSVLVGEGGGL